MCMMSHNKAFFLSLQHAAVSGVAVCLSVRRGAGSVPAGNRGKKTIITEYRITGTRALARCPTKPVTSMWNSSWTSR
ncbi:HCMVUL131 [Human betaherpesvirus 5]|uniref:Uncharacterized protein UL131 n=1 Tax=Human cytomegalovirus (strain AD169) TaxID=10360 RepID=UL131_HCMVA|nr:RecName: Full=Uncharacterized protein UL131 [Human herpesvirus 5 strain AD169]CAA35294.1 HCMVUL131 [Human betaherpesvirus 5]